MKRAIDAARVLVYAAAVIILVCTALCMMLQIKPAVVVSGSMEPAIKTGSLILVNERDKDIKQGDIIAFRAGDASVAHRVIRIEDGGYVTKGDSNRSADVGIVTADDVEGTVLFQLPWAGYGVKWISSVPGMIMTGGAAAVLLTAGYFLDKEETSEEDR